MSKVSAVIVDTTSRPDNLTWRFRSPNKVRSTTDGRVVTGRPREMIPTDGVLVVDLVPGPVIVEYDGAAWLITVPDGPADLWELIEAGQEVTP